MNFFFKYSGIKSNYETSGVDSSVKLDDCTGSLDKSNHVDSILKWAQDAGMATGFVTTTRYINRTCDKNEAISNLY